jgi:hypothetical protein
LGIGLGIWWGVNHPSEAQMVATREQAAVQAKIDLVQQFLGKSTTDQNKADFKQMLNDEKQKLQNAATKLGN